MTTIDWVNCECHRCIKVKDNMAKGLWFHQGLGRLPSKFIDAESGTKIKGFHFFEDSGEKNTTPNTITKRKSFENYFQKRIR